MAELLFLHLLSFYFMPEVPIWLFPVPLLGVILVEILTVLLILAKQVSKSIVNSISGDDFLVNRFGEIWNLFSFLLELGATVFDLVCSFFNIFLFDVFDRVF